jgi:hypothetical protein
MQYASNTKLTLEIDHTEFESRELQIEELIFYFFTNTELEQKLTFLPLLCSRIAFISFNILDLNEKQQEFSTTM